MGIWEYGYLLPTYFINGVSLLDSSLENIKELLGKCERGKKIASLWHKAQADSRSDCDHNTNPFSAL